MGGGEHQSADTGCRDWDKHPAVQQYTFMKKLGEVRQLAC
jgi:hypothetical protein